MDPCEAISSIGHQAKKSKRVGDEIVQAGGADALMGAVRRGGGLKEWELVAWALGALASCSQANRDAIRKAGGLEWLIESLVHDQQDFHSDSLAKHAAATLGTLVSNCSTLFGDRGDWLFRHLPTS